VPLRQHRDLQDRAGQLGALSAQTPLDPYPRFSEARRYKVPECRLLFTVHMQHVAGEGSGSE